MTLSDFPVASVLQGASSPAATSATLLHAAPARTELPEGADVDEILADVAETGVYASSSDTAADLAEVVDRARDEGIDLSVVVVDGRTDRDSQLRDLATDVGEQEGGTVLVLGHDQVGSFSDTVARVTLESGQDHTYTGDPVSAADNFLGELTAPQPPWGLFAALLFLVVALASVGVVVAKVRRASAPRS
ncbi:DUF6676 family protein [Rhodococcus rhodnii]|uniref:Rv1476 family membrane protein n=1 Tax=Rhodococcus rhodnii TaxID=38312 RepID=UPI00039A61C5|nr:DUF6676 family protein [Rhodococcus rhodnii]